VTSRQELYFTAFGDPAPQGSKKVYNGRLVEASKKLRPWRAAVADAVFRAYVATGDYRQFTEPVIVRATFYLPRKPTVKRLLPSVPPDLDKLQRSLGDALSIDAAVLKDDSLIVHWITSKVYADAQDAGVRVGIKVATPKELAVIARLSEYAYDSEEDHCECCGRVIV
jgi:Holliday junction resolvase RusA-like endonuclease